jgi:TonB family protein
MRSLIVLTVLLTACADQPAPGFSAAVNPLKCEDVKPDPRVKPPEIVHRTPPNASMNASGVVTVDLLINAKGEVEGVCSEEGPEELVVAVVDAASRWRFRPATLDGKPVPFRFHLTTSFNGQ